MRFRKSYFLPLYPPLGVLGLLGLLGVLGLLSIIICPLAPLLPLLVAEAELNWMAATRAAKVTIERYFMAEYS
jgi:hypothetical protein